jgi:hypothetical protein
MSSSFFLSSIFFLLSHLGWSKCHVAHPSMADLPQPLLLLCLLLLLPLLLLLARGAPQVSVFVLLCSHSK